MRPMAIVLGPNQYGKAEVRVVAVDRSTPRHTLVDLNVGSTLRGDFAAAHTVGDNAHGPSRLVAGARFGTKMKMFGVPYRVTSVVTALKPDELVEWRHPVGHHWRWEFVALTPTTTRVTETFDFSDSGPIKALLKYYRRTGFAKSNARGIEATLTRLRDRYAG